MTTELYSRGHISPYITFRAAERGGGGGKSDGSKTNFTLMEKLFNIPRLREGGSERKGGRGQAVPPLEEWRQAIRVASFLGGGWEAYQFINSY